MYFKNFYHWDCYVLQPKLARFFIFLKDSNVVFWFYAFTIINKNNYSSKPGREINFFSDSHLAPLNS